MMQTLYLGSEKSPVMRHITISAAKSMNIQTTWDKENK